MFENNLSKQDQIEQCWQEFEALQKPAAPTGRDLEKLFESALKEIQSSTPSSDPNQLRLNVEELMSAR